MTYEYRTNDNPQAMPLGIHTISVHDTAAAAFAAWDWELIRLRRTAGMEHSHLSRVVVWVDPDGTESRVSRRAEELAQQGLREDADGNLVPIDG